MVYFERLTRPDSVGKVVSSSRFNRDTIPTNNLNPTSARLGFFMAYYLYILYSESKDRFYIGQTENVDTRLIYHNSGFVQSTKFGRPWKLVFVKEFTDRGKAMKEEVRLKKAKNRIYLEWYISNG